MHATIAHAAWVAASLPAHARFTRALADPAGTQAQVLRRIVAHQAGTAYSRAHGFGEIRNYSDFARRVPVVDYDNLSPWIARIARGAPGVLTADPVTHLVPTGGSTGGCKLIPFTAGLQREFDAAIAPWIVDLMRTHPGIALGPSYWSISPLTSDTSETDCSLPIGFADDAQYLGGAKARLVRALMAVPSTLRHVTDIDDFRYLTLRSLLHARSLTLISVWHPSFLALLLDALPGWWPELLHDLESGHCPRLEQLPRVVAESCRLAPQAALVRTLRSADPADPRTLWPALRVVSCWADGHAAGPAAELAQRLPHATIQPKGLLATEAFVTLPFRGETPLAVTSHFFEFADERGNVVPIEGLSRDATYEVIVTTGGGLCRYRLGDRVGVTGSIGATPTLRFMGRGGRVSDRFGEKLSDEFVATAIGALTREARPPPKFAMLAPENATGQWRYTLYLETTVGLDWTPRLEAALRANPHYTLCRELGQLGPAAVIRVTNGAETFLRVETTRGRRLGEIKPVGLSLHDGWTEHFQPADHEPPQK